MEIKMFINVYCVNPYSMKHIIRSANCITRDKNPDSDRYNRKDRLLVFDGWSIRADEELVVDSDSDVSVYFDGDQGELHLAKPSEVEELKSFNNLKKESIDVDLYMASDSEQRAAYNLSLPEIFVRNKGKEESFWYPNPTYLFDTETDTLLAANSIDFDPGLFVDGVIVKEDDVDDEEEVCNVSNVVTGASKLFKKQEIESELGERFHALRKVTGL